MCRGLGGVSHTRLALESQVVATMLPRRLGGEDIPRLNVSTESQFSLRKTYVSIV